MTRYLLLSSLLILVACGDDDVTPVDAPADVPVDGSIDAPMLDTPPVDALADAPTDVPTDGNTNTAVCPGSDMVVDGVARAATAVISTDYASTAVSLLGADRSVLSENWITSGTTAPGLTATLGGDVIFPTVQPSDGSVLLLDRFGKNVVTRLCVESGTLVGQMPAGVGFEANPYDVVIDGDVGYLTRYNPNTEPDAVPAEQGSDIVGFDAVNMMRNDFRVDLSDFGGMVMGMDGGAEAQVEIAARPGSLMLFERTLVAVLERSPVNQAGSARGAGEGTVVFIDLDTNELTSLALEGAKNCTSAVVGGDDNFYVSCKGYSEVSFGGPGVRETAGIFHISLAGATPAIADSWRPAEGDPIAVWKLAYSGQSGVVMAIANGTFGVSPDVLVEVNLNTNVARAVFNGSGAFTLGTPFTSDDGVLLPNRVMGDAHMLFFNAAALAGSEDPVRFDVTTALPPNSLSAL